MPLYVLRARIGNALVRTSEGIEAATDEGLEEQAVEAARDLLAQGDLQGLDRRDWVFEVADESGTIVLTLPRMAAAEAEVPPAARSVQAPVDDQPCPRCAGSGIECEAVSALGADTLADLRDSNARYSDHGRRVDMRCSLCSGRGLVAARVGANIAWARTILEDNSAAGRRKWSPERRVERAWLLRLIRHPRQS
jgi:hypothetical protein